MNQQFEAYEEIANDIGAEKSQMFGTPSLKINKKAFACFFNDAMVFKLNGNTHRDALSLDGAELFDPSGKNRPMKEWVQIPYDYKDKWKSFAQEAMAYVESK